MFTVFFGFLARDRGSHTANGRGRDPENYGEEPAHRCEKREESVIRLSPALARRGRPDAGPPRAIIF